ARDALPVRSAVRRHLEGAGPAGGFARAGACQGRRGDPDPTQDRGVLPPPQAVPGRRLRARHHGARVARRCVRCGPAVLRPLEDWDATREYDRTGIDGQTTQVLEVTLPLVTVPLNPGKNLTVVCEVVAINHLLRYSGVDSARSFNDRLLKRLAERRQLQEYLE